MAALSVTQIKRCSVRQGLKRNYENENHYIDGSRVVNRKRRFGARDDDYYDNHDDHSRRACVE